MGGAMASVSVQRMVAVPEAFGGIVGDLAAFLIPLAGGPDDEWVWLPAGPWLSGAD
jgi:hypothetical protein